MESTEFKTTDIELILIDLSSHDSHNDDTKSAATTTTTGSFLNRIFTNVSCYDAIDWLQQTEPVPSSSSVESLVRQDVERFVRTRDRLLALGSVLLKSRAFFQSSSAVAMGDDTANKDAHILVRLPRTTHKKPFIPRRNNFVDDNGALSVSHQFPLIGAAQRLKGNPSHQVGCDIVVQEPLNTRLYETWDDFLHAFRESFSRDEWEIIVSATCALTRLHEFLLRWAVKEAYTKALGVGLGFDFASFAVQFDLPHSFVKQLNDYSSAYQGNVGSVPISLRGKVTGRGEFSASMSETWDFKFVFLSRDPWSWACVAVGPVDDTSCVRVELRWTTLEQLIFVENNGNDNE